MMYEIGCGLLESCEYAECSSRVIEEVMGFPLHHNTSEPLTNHNTTATLTQIRININ